MQGKVKITLATVLTALMMVQAFGETPADSARVLFRVGYSQFNPSLGNNREAMDSFIDMVRKAKELNEIDSIVVRACASPDGTSTANFRLSRLRCNSIAELISQRADIDPTMIHTIPEGVAWGELRRMVADNPDVPSKDKVIDILDNVPLWIYNSKGEIIDGRKKRLMGLDRGNTYRWLLANIFPQLRNAVAIALYTRKTETFSEDREEEKHIPESVVENQTDLSDMAELNDLKDIENAENPEIAENPDNAGNAENSVTHKPFYLAVKTNMLYDAALVPNLSAEFYLGKNLSLYGEWMYAWWENEKRHRSWRIYGGDLGLRWWFGRKAHAKPLTGHHLGIYGGILTFDFATGDHGFLGGKPKGTLWDRHLINAGVEYGYSLPVAKRLNIDFSIGLGYLGGYYIKYFPFDNDLYRDKEINMHFFGPTKAEISLVWLIGRGNRNVRKGGEL